MIGKVAFGTASAECDVGPVETAWSSRTDGTIALRVWFQLPDGVTDLYVDVRETQNCRLYMNGNWFGSSGSAPTCPWWQGSMWVWPGTGWHSGWNVLGVAASSESTFDYLDIEIYVDGPTSTDPSTWGTIKALYR